MAIVENRVSEDGDVLYIKTGVPIVGIIVLSDFVDTIYGETPSVYFDKVFRYSLDGVTYSNWLPLTNQNLSLVSVDARDTLVLEYKYRRVGTSSYDLTFKDVKVSGDYLPVDNSTTYSKSIFAKYFEQNDIEVLNWSINVLEKLYNKGIIAEFLDRNKTDNSRDDRDYVDLWRTTTTFFAYIVVYARRFLNLDNITTLKEFIKQKKCFFSDSNDLASLQYLRDNFYKEMTFRGTLGMLSKVKTENRPVYGEVMRLIGYEPTDEFIFALLEPQNTGWNVDVTAPTWGGLNSQVMLNKAWEDTADVVDIAKYPLIGDVSFQVYYLSVDAANSGVSYDNDSSKLIPVSPNVSYLISFTTYISPTDDLSLTFGVDCFDSSFEVVKCLNSFDGSVSDFNDFFTAQPLQDGLYGQEIRVQGIVFYKDKTEFADVDFDTVLPVGVGNHLIFNEQTAYICPRIVFNSPPTLEGNHYIKDIKVIPYNSTFYEAATVDSGEQVKMWAYNRNPRYSTEELIAILKRYFINYNCGLSYNEVSVKLWDWDITFRPFDHLVVRYIYDVGDLDTQTKFTDNNIESIDGKWVGFSNVSGEGGTYFLLDPSVLPSYNYLWWGGDNTLGGVESALISFSNVAANYPNANKFKVTLGALWWTPPTGTNRDIVVEMTTYIGGTMSKVGYDFVNSGGIQVDTYSVTKTVTLENHNLNFQALAEIEYNANNKKATFKEL